MEKFIPLDSRIRARKDRQELALTTVSPKCLCFFLSCCEPRAKIQLHSSEDIRSSKHCWEALHWKAAPFDK